MNPLLRSLLPAPPGRGRSPSAAEPILIAMLCVAALLSLDRIDKHDKPVLSRTCVKALAMWTPHMAPRE